MKQDNNDSFPAEIYAGTLWQAEMVKSLLENAEIEASLFNQNNKSLFPSFSLGFDSELVKVVVSNVDIDKAIEVVKEFIENERKNN
jgi:hypothetical protein